MNLFRHHVIVKEGDVKMKARTFCKCSSNVLSIELYIDVILTTTYNYLYLYLYNFFLGGMNPSVSPPFILIIVQQTYFQHNGYGD